MPGTVLPARAIPTNQIKTSSSEELNYIHPSSTDTQVQQTEDLIIVSAKEESIARKGHRTHTHKGCYLNRIATGLSSKRSMTERGRYKQCDITGNNIPGREKSK